ncbi:MAG: outer membrane lipoprotein-sorting protein [Deltaproteobacteria bacterium]|nr:outer membrane lipoprotein-sorting protein [Deltaproteobacteria bacterium]
MGARIAWGGCLAWLLLAPAGATETARQILDRQRALDRGERHWTARHQQLALEVIDPRRAPRRLTLDLFDKRYPHDEQRTMAYFSAPESVKGTAFFAVTRPDRAADQWLWLPEARRARRIGGEARKQGFIGTDFTYHDLDLLAEMPSWTEADAASSLEGEATIDGTPCYVIALTPTRADIGYERIVLWLGRDDLVARQVDFFEEAPAGGWFGLGAAETPPTRRFTQRDVRRVGAIPVAFRAEVETPGAGSKTVVTFSEVGFDQALPDELFTQPAMEWGRYTIER